MPINFKSMSLKGQYFKELEELCFFPEQKNRLSIIYGKNGSGKSSIARSFYSYTDNDNTMLGDIWDYEVINLLNYEQDVMSSDIGFSIKMFDENFIEQKIRIKEDGLDSIVMFGEQVEIDSKIIEKKKKIKQLKKSLKELNEKSNEHNDKLNINCPEYYQDKIKTILRSPNGWAYFDSNIKELRQMSAVTNNIIEEISNINPSEDEYSLNDQFSIKYDNYNSIKDELKKIEKPIKKIMVDYNMEKELIHMLSKKIEEPVMTDREKMILREIKTGNQSQITAARNHFLKQEVDSCPFCFREINDKEKQRLENCFLNVINKEVEEHKNELNKIKPKQQELNLEYYKELDQYYIKDVQLKYEQYKKNIGEYIELVENKIDRLYSPIVVEKRGLIDTVINLNKSLEKLEEKRIEHNHNIENIENLKKELLDINKQVAHFKICQEHKMFEEKSIEKNKINEKIIQFGKNIKIIDDEIRDLENQKSNIKIAIDVINKSLAYVFFDNERIKLIPTQNNYKLKVRGNSVTPEKISCGERNVLALCYFFASLFENVDKNDMYSEKMLIIIDDPVSSFDFDNKIGIVSYLKSEMLNVLKGNQSSRVVIMSHDIGIVNSLIKLGDDLIKTLNEKGIYARLMLKDKKIERYDRINENEYSICIQDIYDFANRCKEDNSLSIGNKIRRVIEAFSTFEYKKPFDNLASDENIMNQLSNVKHREYFGNFMYRIILHEESHTEMGVKEMRNMDFLSKFSKDEKIRTAKGVLCFMYLLNPIHIESHLAENKKLLNIKMWCDEIEKSY